MFYGFEDTFKSLEELKQAMIDYIEYHNNSIITVKRKGLTPIQIRNQALQLIEIIFCPTKAVHYKNYDFFKYGLFRRSSLNVEFGP